MCVTKPLPLLTKPLPLLTKPLRGRGDAACRWGAGVLTKPLHLLPKPLPLLTKPRGAMQHGGGGEGVRSAWKLRVGEE